MSAPEVVVELVAYNREIKEVTCEIMKPWTSLAEEAQNVAEVPLERLLVHEPGRNNVVTFLREDLRTPGNLAYYAESVAKAGLALSLHGKVKAVGGEEKYFLMMDFSCPVSREASSRIREFMMHYGYEGVLMVSGNSYHFYSFSLFQEREYIEFMGRCLLFGTHVDVRYIGHRLIEGLAKLRISKSPKHSKLPYLETCIEKNNI